MNPAAVGVGRKDIVKGIKLLKDIEKDSGLPFISSNITMAVGSTHPFPSLRRVKWGENEVAIFSLTRSMPNFDATLGINVLDPVDTAKKVVDLTKDADMVICLSDLGFKDDHALAREVKGINIIIGMGEGQRILSSPSRVEETLILRCADRGRQLGVLDLPPNMAGKGWPLAVEASKVVNLRERLNTITRRIASIEARGESSKGRAEIAKLQKLAAPLEESIREISKNGGGYNHSITVLSSQTKDDLYVEETLKDLGPDPAKNRQKLPQKRVSRPIRPPTPQQARRSSASSTKASALPDGEPYNTGAMSCRRCHTDAYRSWIRTGHSRASLNLSNEQKRDPNCLSCHATKLSFIKGGAIENLVGCEACHGKGSKHNAADGNIKRKVAEVVCASCHKGYHENSSFDFDKDYEAIRCDRAE
ncbi:MAG: hypothetical protein C0608_11535 [Deltaproteobacteria bacterium]|nr:MAG: hypothetical protein C0608_11535 [Deltaproteobacteria bacterium]